MADYGSSTDLGYLCTAIADDVSSNMKSYALEVSTTWVKSQVEGVSTSSVPDLVEKAATFYAYAFLLRNLYDTSISDTPIAIWYEKEAYRLLESYTVQTANEDSEIHPYSSSETPTHRYTERDIRTTTDEDNDIYNVPEDGWESER